MCEREANVTAAFRKVALFVKIYNTSTNDENAERLQTVQNEKKPLFQSHDL